MRISQIINSISEEEKTPISLNLVNTIQLQTEQIRASKDGLARLKGVRPKSKISSQYLKLSSSQALKLSSSQALKLSNLGKPGKDKNTSK